MTAPQYIVTAAASLASEAPDFDQETLTRAFRALGAESPSAPAQPENRRAA